jgi:tripartite ATP-independent transporter DctM subunit
MTLVLLLVALIVLIALRVPVAIALLATSFGYIIFTGTGSMRVALQQTIGGMDSFPLLAIPLFILLGNLAVVTDIAGRLFALADALIGRVRGGLGYVNVVSSLLFSTLSHSAIADAAALGRVQIPEMTKRGYDKKWSIGLTAGASLIGPILPPSVPAILYAVTAGVSIGGLFAASILPVVLVFLTLCVMVFVYGQKMKKKKNVDLRSGAVYSAGQTAKVALSSLPALLTPVILIGGILAGVFTPTEAAAVSVVYLAGLGLIYRKLPLRAAFKVLADSAATAASILIVLGASGLYGWILTREGAGRIVADAVANMGDNHLPDLRQHHPAARGHVHGVGARDPHLRADPWTDRRRPGDQSAALRRDRSAEPRDRIAHTTSGHGAVRTGRRDENFGARRVQGNLPVSHDPRGSADGDHVRPRSHRGPAASARVPVSVPCG